MNILVTGGNGFIGSNIIQKLSLHPNLKLFNGNRKTIDLYNKDSVSSFIEKYKIDSIIHCAIQGGRFNKKDSAKVMYNNILMFQNVLEASTNIKRFINIASGAEFNKFRDVYSKKSNTLGDSIPTDYYGLSKYIIAKQVKEHPNKRFINLRLFGCFGPSESSDRMIRNNLEKYINDSPIIIHQDKYMDYFYINDLITVLNHCLVYGISQKDCNLTYSKKYKLSDIANIINDLSEKKVPVIINEPTMGTSYCSGYQLPKLPIKLIGLKQGIKECYEQLKN